MCNEHMCSVHLASFTMHRVIIIDFFSFLTTKKKILLICRHYSSSSLPRTSSWHRVRSAWFSISSNVQPSNETTRTKTQWVIWWNTSNRFKFTWKSCPMCTWCAPFLHWTLYVIMWKHEDITLHLNSINCNQFTMEALHKWAKTLTKLTDSKKRSWKVYITRSMCVSSMCVSVSNYSWRFIFTTSANLLSFGSVYGEIHPRLSGF